MSTPALFAPDALRAEVCTYLQTVEEVLAWYDRHEWRTFAPVAVREKRRLWGLFGATYGRALLAHCRPGHLTEFIAAQRGVHSNWTRRRIKATINKPFNVAIEAGLIGRNPFAGLRIPEGGCGRDWTAAEFRALLVIASPAVRRLIVFCRFSGARSGEARNLEWPQIRAEIDAIIQAKHKTAAATGAPRRIYFNSVLAKLLTWLARHKTHATHVFTNHQGRPWTLGALTKHIRVLCRRAGLAEDVRLHGSRHAFATNAIVQGVDLATLAQLLGHRSVKTTERYLHLVNQRAHLNAAMERAIGR